MYSNIAKNKRKTVFIFIFVIILIAALGWIIGGVDDVLDRDRNAMQRPNRATAAAPGVAFTRLRQRLLGIEMSESADSLLGRGDAVKAGRRYLLG